MYRIVLFFLLAGTLCAALFIAGCPSPTTPAIITVTPQSPQVDVGETVQLSATSTDAQDTFAWSSTATSVATVDNNGVATGVSPGTATIRATGSHSGRSGTATVTVESAGEGEGEEPWAPDKFTYDVQLAPDVTVVKGTALNLLVDSDTENHTYTFDNPGVQAAGLDLSSGQILMLEGITVRRITNATVTGNDLMVETKFVSLNEAITDGTIGWDYGVEFTADKIEAVELPDGKVIYTKAGEPIAYAFTLGDYKYEILATLENTCSDVKITITKGLGSVAEGKFTVEGEIKRFRSKNSIRFEGGEVREINNQLGGMQGDLTLELTVASTSEIDFVYDLPTIMRVPFQVGIIPVVLSVKLRFQIVTQVPFDGSSSIRTGFSYNSDLGFTYNGVSIQTAGGLGGIEFEEDLNQTGASSPIGAKFGVAFPRVELSIIGEPLTVWAQPVFYISGTFTPAFPACQTADAEFSGQAGYNFSLFGLFNASDWTSFFSETYVLLRTAECPPDKDWLEGWSVDEVGPAYAWE